MLNKTNKKKEEYSDIVKRVLRIEAQRARQFLRGSGSFSWRDVQQIEGLTPYPEFPEAYTRVRELQKMAIYKGGLSGVCNSNIVALIASHER